MLTAGIINPAVTFTYGYMRKLAKVDKFYLDYFFVILDNDATYSNQEANAMSNSKTPAKKPAPSNSSRIPENSTFYQKIVPALLITMAVITTGLILFAVGVLIEVISF